MLDTPFFALFVLFISPFVGSFIGVLVDRLPRGQNVTTEPSKCRQCSARLSVRDMVPLLSFLFLRGKCRHCKADIPQLLPIIEIAAIVVIILWVWLAKSNVELLIGAMFLWCLVALFFCDITRFILPNALTLSLAVIALIFAWQNPSIQVQYALFSGIIGFLTFYIIRITYKAIRKREGLGMGDVKLMAGIGAGVGAEAIPMVIILAAITGIIWLSVRFWHAQRAVTQQTILPFGAFLSLGCAIIWLFLP